MARSTPASSWSSTRCVPLSHLAATSSSARVRNPEVPVSGFETAWACFVGRYERRSPGHEPEVLTLNVGFTTRVPP